MSKEKQTKTTPIHWQGTEYISLSEFIVHAMRDLKEIGAI